VGANWMTNRGKNLTLPAHFGMKLYTAGAALPSQIEGLRIGRWIQADGSSTGSRINLIGRYYVRGALASDPLAGTSAISTLNYPGGRRGAKTTFLRG
jgi:hypothetical protein